MIQKIEPINPIIGDDYPYNTIHYKDVPSGFRFDNIAIEQSEYPEIYKIKNDLINFANLYFDSWEIVGETFQDFFNGLVVSFKSFAKIYDKKLGLISNLDINVGSKTVRNRTGSNKETGLSNRQTASVDGFNNTVNGSNEEIVLSFDTSNSDPNNKNVNSETTVNTSTSNQNESINNNVNSSESENETIYVSEDSISFYERVLENYPNIRLDFIESFKDNFTLKEVMIW